MSIFTDWGERLNSYFSNFSEKIQMFMDNPTCIIGLFGLGLVIFALFKFKKVKLDAKVISRIGIAVALSCVLQIFRIYHFPMGGSITLGGMIPLLILAFMYGPEIGFLGGFIYGILNLFLDPYFLHPVQILFDYPLPSLAIGLAGFFKDKPLLGTTLAFFAKFICHFISGVVFFGSYGADYGLSPISYSIAVNLPMAGIECIICLVILIVLPLKSLVQKAQVVN